MCLAVSTNEEIERRHLIRFRDDDDFDDDDLTTITDGGNDSKKIISCSLRYNARVMTRMSRNVLQCMILETDCGSPQAQT